MIFMDIVCCELRRPSGMPADFNTCLVGGQFEESALTAWASNRPAALMRDNA